MKSVPAWIGLLTLILAVGLSEISAYKITDIFKNKDIIVPDTEEKVLLMVGGLYAEESMGRSVPTLNGAHIVFSSGEMCYPHDVHFDRGLGGGFALTDENRIFYCFGFQGPDPFKGCTSWTKGKLGEGIGSGQNHTAILTGDLDYIEDVWKQDQANVIFPTFTFCQSKEATDQSCVIFSFNAKDMNPSKVLKAELLQDPDKVKIVKITELATLNSAFPYRSCFVISHFPNKAILFLIGGSNIIVDYLNSADPRDFVKLIDWDPKLRRTVGPWRNPKCKIEIQTLHHHCINVQRYNNTDRSEIVLVGGDDDHNNVAHKDLQTLFFTAKYEVLSYENYSDSCQPGQEAETRFLYRPESSESRSLSQTQHVHLAGIKDATFGFLGTEKDRYVVLSAGGRIGMGRDSKVINTVHIVHSDKISADLDQHVITGSHMRTFEMDVGRYGNVALTVPAKMMAGQSCLLRVDPLMKDFAMGGGGGKSASGTILLPILLLTSIIIQ